MKRLALLGVLGWLFWTGRSYSVANEGLESHKTEAGEHSATCTVSVSSRGG